jgi:hypothetical protein
MLLGNRICCDFLCVQPWIFTEIKEQRHWDITAEERLNILRDYVAFGLKHWGSDTKGSNALSSNFQ